MVFLRHARWSFRRKSSERGYTLRSWCSDDHLGSIDASCWSPAQSHTMEITSSALQRLQNTAAFLLLIDDDISLQVCHCIWLLSYTAEIKPRLADMQIAAVLTHILKQVQKEKVVRMILGTFANLVGEGEMENVLSVCGECMLFARAFCRWYTTCEC